METEKENNLYTLHETVKTHRFYRLKSVPGWYFCSCGLIGGYEVSDNKIIATSFINIAAWDPELIKTECPKLLKYLDANGMHNMMVDADGKVTKEFIEIAKEYDKTLAPFVDIDSSEIENQQPIL